MVWLKIRPYILQTLARKINEKLSARFFGLYEVEAKIGKVAYRLKLPAEAKLHPTFHVSQLKRVVGDSVAPSPIPPHLMSDLVLEMFPEKILDTRTNPN